MFPIPNYLNYLNLIKNTPYPGADPALTNGPMENTPRERALYQPLEKDPNTLPTVAAPPVKASVADVNTDPNSMPFHKAYSDIVPTMPSYTDPRYKPKWWENILNAVAGGLAGAAGHPEIGGKLHDNKYNIAMGEYQNKLGAIAPLMKDETTGAGLGLKLGTFNAGQQQKADTTNANNNLKVDIANLKGKEFGQAENRRVVDSSRKNEYQKDIIRLRAEELERKRKNDEKDKLSTPEKNFQGVERLKKNLMDQGMSETEAMNKIGTDLGMSSAYNPVNSTNRIIATTPAEVNRKKAEEQAGIDVKTNPENVKKEADRVKALEEAKAAPALDPVVVENYKASKDKSNFMANLDTKTKAAMYKIPGFDPPKKMNAQEQSQFDNGRVTLNHIDSMRGLLKDPFIQKNLGAIAGRIALVKQTIGGKQYENYIVKGAPVSGDAREQQFLTSAAQLLNWEVKNVAGNRPAHQLFDRLSKTAPSGIKSLESNLGALSAIETSVTNTMDGYAGIVHTDNKDTKPTGGKKFSEMLQEVK